MLRSPCHSARQDSVVPLSKPAVGVDGTEIHEIAVPSGTAVFVSILNANRNPELWGKGDQLFKFTW